MENKKDLYGLIPGFVQRITRVDISCPPDIVKVQKQLFPTTLQTIKYIFKHDLFKFYRGSSMSYFVIDIERSIQFYILEKLKKM